MRNGGLMLGHLLLLQNTGHLVALGLAAGVSPQLQLKVSIRPWANWPTKWKNQSAAAEELIEWGRELTRCLANFKARFSLPSFNNSAKER